MEITKENVAALLVQHGVIPQALVDQLDGDEHFLNVMDVVVGLAHVGKTLLGTDDNKDLLSFAVRIFLMGPEEGTKLCRVAALILDIGGSHGDVRSFIGAALREARASKLAEIAIAKASAH